jgi:UDP-glucose 4-epimerase
MKTAAVFGAAGKLGRHLLPELARRGYKTRALVHRTPIAGDVVSVQGDIANAAAVENLVRGADIVIQLATTKEDRATFFDVSIRGTFNILEACRRHPIRQFILFGGDAAFGIWFHPQPIPIDENHRHGAYPGYYAFSKVIEEVMTEQYAVQYGVAYTTLRCSWVMEGMDLLRHFSILHNIGPAEKGHGFGEVTEDVMALVRARQERIPVLLDRQGAPLRRHIVHVEDVVQAFGRALDNPAALGQSFNIAGPAPFDYRVAADYLARKLGHSTVDLRCPDYHPFEINITRARSVLGYAPTYDFFRMADDAVHAASLS